MTVLALLSSLALASPAEISAGDEVKRFEVLDINSEKKLIAYKVLYTESFEGSGAHDCGYAGMQGMAGVGVKLGLWNLESARNDQEFVVYASVMSEDECTPHSESEKRLAAAKEAFTAAGLDITRKPSPVDVGQTLTWPGGATGILQFKTSESDDEMEGVTSIVVKRNGQEIYTRDVSYARAGAGYLTVQVSKAWAVENGLVMLETWTAGGMRGRSLGFRFSKVLPAE